MKKIALLLSFITVLFVSCSTEGTQGPPGPQGPQGPAGSDGILGQVFEVEVDFTAANNYQFLVEFPATIEVFDSDIVIAYILDEVDNGVDIWEPLPQTLFLGNDILLYGYDHTFFDINFFMDGTVDLGTLDAIYTDAIVFRVAIIPADFAETLDLTNMKQVMDALKIETVAKVQ